MSGGLLLMAVSLPLHLHIRCSPVIGEVLQMQVSTQYFHYLRHKLRRAALAQWRTAATPTTGSGQAPAQQQRQRTWFGGKPREVPKVLAGRGSALWTWAGCFGDPDSRHWKRVFGVCRADERR